MPRARRGAYGRSVLHEAFTCVTDGTSAAPIVRPRGELDAATARTFREAATAAILTPGARTVEVDLSFLAFVDSSGLREVIDASRLAEAHDVRLTLSGATHYVRQTFVLVGLEALLQDDGAAPA